ncbi:hypothetical protein QUA82_33250 [Microcoleus sp. F8-D3]
MSTELERVKQLVDLDPVPEAIVKSVDMAWAVYRKGQIPDNYLICIEMFWDKICQVLGYIPARIKCSVKGQVYISFTPQQIHN